MPVYFKLHGRRVGLTRGPQSTQQRSSTPTSHPAMRHMTRRSRRHLTTFDTSKADRLLGFRYLNLDESTRDIIEQFRGKGWI